jgi:hypothetical protein
MRPDLGAHTPIGKLAMALPMASNPRSWAQGSNTLLLSSPQTYHFPRPSWSRFSIAVSLLARNMPYSFTVMILLCVRHTERQHDERQGDEAPLHHSHPSASTRANDPFRPFHPLSRRFHIFLCHRFRFGCYVCENTG